jgi:hypothetical protein
MSPPTLPMVSRVVHKVRPCETVPGTGEAARFPVETLGTHKDGNAEHNVKSGPDVLSYVGTASALFCFTEAVSWFWPVVTLHHCCWDLLLAVALLESQSPR